MINCVDVLINGNDYILELPEPLFIAVSIKVNDELQFEAILTQIKNF